MPAAFDEQDFGFPVVTLGVEANYVDFGAPSGDVVGSQIEVDANGFDAGSDDGTDPAYGVGIIWRF